MSETPSAELPGAGRRSRFRGVAGCLLFGIGGGLGVATVVAIVFAWGNRPPDLNIPTPTLPTKNGFDELVRLGKRAKNMKHKGPISSSQNVSISEMAECAKESEPIIAAMRRALPLPFVHPPKRKWDEEDGGAALRALARTVTDVVMYHEARGEYDKAAVLLLDGLDMSVKIPIGGAFIEDMVEDACFAICAFRLEIVMPKIPRPRLQYVTSRLGTIAARTVQFEKVVQEEGHYTVSSYAHWLKEPRSFQKYIEDLSEHLEMVRNGIPLFSPPPPPPTWQSNMANAWSTAKFAIADKSSMLREIQQYYRTLTAEVRKPYSGPTKTPLPSNPFAWGCDLIARNGWLAHARTEAQARLLHTRSALLWYQSEKGRDPASLAALVPKYMNAIPHDPFGGGPLRYRLAGGKGKAFSIGPDLKDDSGKSTARFAPTGPGDIVAGNLWPPRYPSAAAKSSP